MQVFEAGVTSNAAIQLRECLIEEYVPDFMGYLEL
jgi:hypothetical protein